MLDDIVNRVLHWNFDALLLNLRKVFLERVRGISLKFLAFEYEIGPHFLSVQLEKIDDLLPSPIFRFIVKLDVREDYEKPCIFG